MANEYFVNAADLTVVADAIREKGGTSESIVFPGGFVSEIQELNSLNFEIVGSTTQPENPKENMIWVNTSVIIPFWSISAAEPSEPDEGFVWIKNETETNSGSAFNALQTNEINIAPSRVTQYVSGAWTHVNAKIYQHGQWRDIITPLYDGDSNTKFSVIIKTSEDVSPGLSGGKMKYSLSDSDNTWSYMCALRYLDPLDLTTYSTMKIDLDSVSVSGSGAHFFVSITPTKIDAHGNSEKTIFAMAESAVIDVKSNVANSTKIVDISSYEAGCYIYMGVMSGSTYLPCSSSAFSNTHNGNITAIVSKVEVY